MKMRAGVCKHIYYGFAVLLLVGLVIVTKCVPVTASAINWVGTTLHYSEVPNQDIFPPQQSSGCVTKTMALTVGSSEKEASVCLNEKATWSYGRYTYDKPTWYGSYVAVTGYAVRFGTSGPMHRMTSSIAEPNINVPNSDAIIILSHRADTNNYFNIYKDLRDHLTAVTQSDGEVQYAYNETLDFTLGGPNNGDIAVYSRPGISNNGKWVAMETDRGFLRVNLETFAVKRFTPMTYNYTIGYGPGSQFAITNDGRHVAVMGNYNHNFGSHPGYHLYDISDDCGDVMGDMGAFETPTEHSCPSGSFESTLRENYSSTLDRANYPEFDDDGGQLTLEVFSSGDNDPPKWVQLTIAGYAPLPHITYLALGDSYTSGEGDSSSNGAHYLQPTSGAKGCHLSDRSYPFLLRDAYSISPENMESVACSGAQVSFDYMGTDDNYIGQNEQLKNMPAVQKEAARQKSLDNFIPGYVKQLDFVKKYQPAIITLTGGGNDVGFANILTYCAEPYMILGKLPESMTCAYAIPGSELHDMLYDSIDSQYKTTKLLIEKIQNASPNSRIVIISYPSFISSDGVCTPIASAGYLDDAERRMINEAGDYMNTMLSSVAHDMDVSFVDMTHALDGGRMCEGNKYMTTVTDWATRRAAESERFHPNYLGHIKMAETIENSDVFNNPKVPETSDYTPNPNSILTRTFGFVNSLISKIKQVQKLASDPGMFKPNTSIEATLHSDSIDLGTYKADANGGFSATISTKNLPTGEHVLVVDGTGPDGKPVRYYQYVYIEDGDNTKATEENTKSGNIANSSHSIIDTNEPNHKSTDKVEAALSGDSGTKLKETPKRSLIANRPTSSLAVYTGLILLIIIGGILYYAKQKKQQ